MSYYKAFDENLQCKGFQYEVGKTYKLEEGEKLEICNRGFHFCKSVADCFDYYPKNKTTRFCEVEPLGEIVQEDNKYATNKIKIIRELTQEEINQGNIGVDNIGWCNEGDCNKGDCNEGNSNIGIANKGSYQCGVGCTNAPLILFNKPSKHTLKELYDSGVIYDIMHHDLTDRVKALDTFDMEVWEKLEK